MPKLLAKIEELTLYVIKQQDEIDALKKAISKTVNDSIKTTRLLKNFPTKFKRAVFSLNIRAKSSQIFLNFI